jgi:lysophospholipase L1-like esterase
MRRFSRVRLAAFGSVLACLLALAPAVPAQAGSTSNSHPSTYLALGDSVPFGYNPVLLQKLLQSGGPRVDPGAFVGYPQLAANLFRPKLKVFNASCPGETSGSLISMAARDNGCQSYRRLIGGLHVSYRGSQLQYAESYLTANPRTKFVSLMIGANDLFLLQDSCAQTADVDGCILAGLPGLLSTLRANLKTIYKGLRATGFNGDFVAVTYYSTNYRDPVVTGAVGAVDLVLAGVTLAFRGKVADGFGAFARAAAPFGGDTCATGLLIHLPSGACDVHPTRAGAALLASALHATQGR